MKTIICNVSMFELHQPVVVIDEDGERVVAVANLENLDEMISEACDEYEIYDIHLFGNEDYLTDLIERIHTYHTTNYGYKEINIEVN